MKIVIVRNRRGVEYFHNKSVTYLCLTLESYHFAKKTDKNVLYPYKFNQLHDVDYYDMAKKLSYEHLDSFYKELDLKGDEKAYLVSRIITFFAMTIFDINLAKSIVNKYKNDDIYCFSEKNISIVKGEWSPSSGFHYFIEILKIISKNNGINLYFYKENFSSEDSQRKNNILLDRAEKYKFYLTILTKDLSFFFNNGRKDLIYVSGIRGCNAELVKDLDSKGFNVIHNTGSLVFKSLSRVLLFFHYKKNTDWRYHKSNRINRGFLDEYRGFLYKNNKVFDSEFVDIDKLIRLYCFERDMYVYFFKKKPPIAVVSQNNSIQILAANSLNIKTFHISHGIVVTPELSPMLGKYNYLSSKVQSDYHFSKEMAFNNTVKIPPIHISTKSHQAKKVFKSEDHRVILLAKNMGMRRWEFDDYKEYFLLCESVVNATKKFGCELLVKIHPSGGRHMLDIYKSLGIFKHSHVSVSISSDYMDELNGSSIVISMQESSAIFQAICKERLVIFPTSHYSKPYKNNIMLDYISSNITSPKNTHDLDAYLLFILKSHENYDISLERQKTVFSADVTCASKSEVSKKISKHIVKYI